MQFLVSATVRAVTGNAIARYQKANRPIRLKHDAMPIGVGAAVPLIFIEVAKWFIEASIYQLTPLRMLQTAMAGAMIAYSISPKDSVTPVTKDTKTDDNKPATLKTNTNPQTIPTTPPNPLQVIPTTTQNPNETKSK